jgi:hypothetical protein
MRIFGYTKLFREKFTKIFALAGHHGILDRQKATLAAYFPI